MEIPTPDASIPTPDSSIPVPRKKSFFNSKKRINRFATFLIIAGIGAMWLTYWWNETDSNFGSFPVLYYYIFNSALLFLLGVFLHLKEFKIYSVLAVVLGISVTSSLFIFTDNNFNNLFFYTVFMGVTFGTVYGGIILVPMFLWGVYRSLFRGIKHLRGKAIYNPS